MYYTNNIWCCENLFHLFSNVTLSNRVSKWKSLRQARERFLIFSNEGAFSSYCLIITCTFLHTGGCSVVRLCECCMLIRKLRSEGFKHSRITNTQLNTKGFKRHKFQDSKPDPLLCSCSYISGCEAWIIWSASYIQPLKWGHILGNYSQIITL